MPCLASDEGQLHLHVDAPTHKIQLAGMSRCKNCNTPLGAGFQFCPQCGQKNIELERPLPELLGEAVREAIDVDGRALRTLWALLRQPGLLTSEFLAGRRRFYTPPVRLYLVISLLFFLLTAWIAGKGILLNEGQTLESDAVGQARLFADYVPQLMFVLLPVFAMLLKVAFRQRLYFHHIIHSLHLHSAAYIVLGLMLPLERAAAGSVLAMAAQLFLFVYMLAYFVISVHRVYRTSWFVAAGKFLGILIAYTMLIAGSMEALSHLMMPDSTALPFLTD
jgi:hypothetical protein